MGRVLVIGLAAAGMLVLWKAGILSSLQPATVPRLDPGPVISQSGVAMQQLKSLHVTLGGTVVANNQSVDVTGSGDLIFPHQERLTLQLRTGNRLVAVNERIEQGRIYLQVPSASPEWKDVTGDRRAQVAPEMDPIANLGFARAIRAGDDLGDLFMDGIITHHFSLNVDTRRYLTELEADPNNGLTPEDRALLIGAGIQVEVWIGASDQYLRQMKISMTTSAFRWDVVYRYADFVKATPTTV